jgi:hypothetical protein
MELQNELVFPHDTIVEVVVRVPAETPGTEKARVPRRRECDIANGDERLGSHMGSSVLR